MITARLYRSPRVPDAEGTWYPLAVLAADLTDWGQLADDDERVTIRAQVTPEQHARLLEEPGVEYLEG